MSDLPCFKSYDLRGRIPDELNSEIAYLVGRAYVEFLKPSKVIVGHDIRLSSPMICNALIDGLTDSGCDVYHIGECGTEEIYFATDHFDMDGGIVVTASHNPKDYNGMKLIREASKPISGDTGLEEIKQLVLANNFSEVQQKGSVIPLDHRAAYVDKLIEYINPANVKPLKIVTNAGNGGAGAIIDRLESSLPFEFIKVHHQADGNFPNGVPNPLLEENRAPTIDAIQQHGADLGIAWDGDFDRCFFFDADGRFIEGYYIVGLLAQSFLDVDSDNSVIHDPRLTWNTIDIVNGCGGTAIQSKTGHAFIKERMRIENAIYGGEMSAHHYFRDFSYCDSGMVPWLLVVGLMCSKGISLAELVNERMTMFPVSGEINRGIDDPAAVIEAIERRFKDSSIAVDHTDGLSMEFADWRFNVRMSNTEPVVRLNVESRADEPLMQKKTAELLSLMSET